MLIRLRRCGRALFENRSGVSAVEFAFIGPIILALALGTLQIGIALFVEEAMEGALRTAARTGITDDLPAGYASREAYIRDLLEKKSGGILAKTNPRVSVTEKIYKTFNELTQDEPFSDLNNNGIYDSGEPFTDTNGNGVHDSHDDGAGAGGACDLVKYTVTYNMFVPGLASARRLSQLFRPGGSTTASDSISMTVQTVVMNEPWNTATSSGCNNGTLSTLGGVS